MPVVVQLQNQKSKMILGLDANGVVESVQQGWLMVTTMLGAGTVMLIGYFRASKAYRKLQEAEKKASFDKLVGAVQQNTEAVDGLTKKVGSLTMEQHQTNTHLEVLTERVNNLDRRVTDIEKGK